MNINKPYDNQINLLMGITDNTVNPFPHGLDPDSNRATGDNFADITKNKSVPAPKAFPWFFQSFLYLANEDYPSLDKQVYKHASSAVSTSVIQSNGGNVSINSLQSGYVGVLRARFYNSVGGAIPFTPNWDGSILIYNNGTQVSKFNSQVAPTKTYFPVYVGWNNIDIYFYSKADGSTLSLGIDFTNFAELWEVGGSDLALPPVNVVTKTNQELLGKRDSNAVTVEWDITEPDKTKEFVVYRRGPFITGMNLPIFDTGLSSGVAVSGVVGVYTRYYEAGSQETGTKTLYIREPMYYAVSAVYSGLETVISTPVRLYHSGLFYNPDYFSVSASPDIDALLPLDTYYTYLVTASTPYIDLLPLSGPTVSIYTSEYSNLVSWPEIPGASFYKVLRATGVVDLDFFLSGNGQLLDTVTGVFEYVDSGVFSGLDLYSGLNIVSDTNLPDIGMSNLDPNFRPTVNYGTNSFDVRWQFTPSGQDPDYFKVYRSVSSGIFNNSSVVALVPFTTSGNINSGYIDSNGGSPDLTATSAVPKILVQVSRPDRNTFSYVDSNLKNRATYEYRVAAVNYLGIEGVMSEPVYVTAGDTTAPATPSGLSVTGLEYMANITWVNGGEEDYLATNVYYSPVETGSYSVIRKIDGQFSSIPLGYATTGYFKLSNTDLNDNESPLTNIITGVTPAYTSALVSGSSTVPSGILTGTGSSTDNAIVLWDGTGGNKLKDSTLTWSGSVLSTPGLFEVANGVMYVDTNAMVFYDNPRTTGVNWAVIAPDGAYFKQALSIGDAYTSEWSLVVDPGSGISYAGRSGVPFKDVWAKSGYFENLILNGVPFSPSSYVTTGILTGYLQLTGGTMSNNIAFPNGYGITSAAPNQSLSVSSSSGVSINGNVGPVVISNGSGYMQIAGNDYLQLASTRGIVEIVSSDSNITMTCNTTGTIRVFSDVYTTGHIRPTVTNTKDLGNLNARWANLFATNLNGTYFSSDSTANAFSRNLTTSSSGTLSIGSSGVPFGSGYFKDAYITNLHGLSPITLHDNIVPVSSGNITIGTSGVPLSGIYTNQINGVQIFPTTATAPITVTSGLVAIASGSASQNGYISSGDWATFNNKQSSGNYVTSGSSVTFNNITASGSVSASNVAKAWVSFSGDATPTITSSYNISSVTRDGVGNYKLTFTNNAPNTNYCGIVNGSQGAVFYNGPNAKTVSGCNIYVYNNAAIAFDDGANSKNAVFYW